MRRVLLYTAIIVATLVMLLLAWQFRVAFFLFALSLFIAAALRPLVDALSRRGLSTGLAQLLLYVVAIGGLVLFVLLVGDVVMEELNNAVNWTVVEYETFYNLWAEGGGWQQTVSGMLPQPFVLGDEPGAGVELLLPIVMRLTSGLTSSLASAFLLLAASIYWSVDRDRFERLILSWLPAQQRVYVRDNWREVEAVVGEYIRFQTVQSIIIAVAVGVGALLFGFPFPVLAALVAGIAAVIPVLGGLFATLILAGLGSLESVSLAIGMALLAAVVFIGTHFLVRSRLKLRRQLSLVLTFLLLIPLSQTFGIWGLIVTPPLAIALEVLITRGYLLVQQARSQPEAPPSLTELEQRYEKLCEEMATKNGELSQEMGDLIERLDRLLEESAGLPAEDASAPLMT